MNEVLRFAPAIGQDLIGGHCDWADFLPVPSVFTDLLRRNRCLIKELIDPLRAQRLCLSKGSACGIWSRTECQAQRWSFPHRKEDNYAAAAAHVAPQMENLRRIALVVTQGEVSPR